MSRSHRKTPVCGITCAGNRWGDKPFKVAAHKRLRRKARQLLQGNRDEEVYASDFKVTIEVSNSLRICEGWQDAL